MTDLMQKMSQEEDWKRELGHVVFARRPLILATAAVVLVGAILIALFWPATYAATSSLLVLGKRTQISTATLDPVEFRDPEVSTQDIISELEIIRSPELARRVVHQLRKADGCEEANLEKNIAKAVQNFAGRLEVTGIADSSAIRIQMYDHSAQSAEKNLQILLDEYIQYRAEVFNPVGQDQFFEGRMEHYRNQLNELVDRIGGEAGEMSPAFIDQVLEGKLARLALLQQQLGELEMELAVSTYVDNTPLTTRIDIVQSAIAKLQQETNEMQGKRLLADSVYREAALISHSFDTFAKRAEEAKINDSIARNRLAGDISILSRGVDSAELVFPRKIPTLFMGLIVAIISGLSVGFLAEFFDHAVRRPEDVQKTTGLAVLCSFPTLVDEDDAAEGSGSTQKLKQTASAASENARTRVKTVFGRRDSDES